jgi:hypothetical protein
MRPAQKPGRFKPTEPAAKPTSTTTGHATPNGSTNHPRHQPSPPQESTHTFCLSKVDKFRTKEASGTSGGILVLPTHPAGACSTVGGNRQHCSHLDNNAAVSDNTWDNTRSPSSNHGF